MLERIITALILVAVVLCCMFATTSQYPMFALMVVAAAVGGYEWFKLMPNQSHQVEDRASAQADNQWFAYGYALLMGLCAVISLYFKELSILFWSASIITWVVSLYWVIQYPKNDHWYNHTLLILGVILICAAVTSIFALWVYSPWWLMYVFLLVWGADSGAYFVGRKFGMHKLAPEVSPNKSIEGLIGGIVTAACIIVVVAYSFLSLSFTHLIAFLILSLVTVLASVQGDLFESMLKRRAGIKDSGRVLPGHGGVLDRIDSLLAAAPIFAAGLYFFVRFGLIS